MVTEQDFVSPLRAALGDLAAWWQSEKVPGIVIGGVAASLLGRPRLTRDVDGLVVIPDKDWPKFLSSSARFHFFAAHRQGFGFCPVRVPCQTLC